MTKLFVMSVKDTAVQAFNPPFCSQADAAAIRDMKQLVNKEETRLAQSPDDYELYCIAMWDDQTGIMEPVPARLVCRLKDLVTKES